MGSKLYKSHHDTPSKDTATTSNSQDYNPHDDCQYYIKLQNITGRPSLIQNKTSKIWFQQYEIELPSLSKEVNMDLYRLRSSSYSKCIVVVFDYELINEDCSRFMVQTQKMVGRLKQMSDLGCIKALVIFQKVLNGFIELMKFCKQPFLVSDKMIGLNESNQVRVWVNQNFALNCIPDQNRLPNQGEMIYSIQKAIEAHISDTQIKPFYDSCFQLFRTNSLIQSRNRLATMLSKVNKKLLMQETTQALRSSIKQEIINRDAFTLQAESYSGRKKQSIISSAYKRLFKLEEIAEFIKNMSWQNLENLDYPPRQMTCLKLQQLIMNNNQSRENKSIPNFQKKLDRRKPEPRYIGYMSNRSSSSLIQQNRSFSTNSFKHPSSSMIGYSRTIIPMQEYPIQNNQSHFTVSSTYHPQRNCRRITSQINRAFLNDKQIFGHHKQRLQRSKRINEFEVEDPMRRINALSYQ